LVVLAIVAISRAKSATLILSLMAAPSNEDLHKRFCTRWHASALIEVKRCVTAASVLRQELATSWISW
jgi:hypothetical protein